MQNIYKIFYFIIRFIYFYEQLSCNRLSFINASGRMYYHETINIVDMI
jgi:hypothetical protein